jgi:hypothetical protein
MVDLLHVDYCDNMLALVFRMCGSLVAAPDPCDGSGVDVQCDRAGRSTYGGETGQTWRRFPGLWNMWEMDVGTEVVDAAG